MYTIVKNEKKIKEEKEKLNEYFSRKSRNLMDWIKVYIDKGQNSNFLLLSKV